MYQPRLTIAHSPLGDLHLTTDRHQPSPWFAERMGLYFATLFLIYGVHVTYYPVWLSGRGLRAEEIGLITAMPIFMRTLLTPMIAAYADQRGNHRAVIIALSIAGVVLTGIISQCTTFMSLLVTSVPFAIVVASIMPLTETIAVTGVRGAGHDYGRMRLWGSLTFLVATIVSGLMFDAYGADVGIWILLAACCATAAASALLPKPVGEPPATAIDNRVAEAAVSVPAVKLLTMPVFAAFLLAIGAIHGAHAAFYTFGALHFKSLGFSGATFGWLWAVSVIVEIGVFAYSKQLVARFGATQLIIAAGVASVIRWGGMSLNPSFGMVLLLQVLHGLTYGAGHLGAIHFIARAVPTLGAGTAQGLYSAIGSGFITGLATLASGYLYPVLGGQTFLAMGALAGAGLVAAVWLHKTWDRTALLKG
jgi:MFS transporter, PPP family, 3-phenylpropionic acid transporter